jgi:hypothetical protein
MPAPRGSAILAASPGPALAVETIDTIVRAAIARWAGVRERLLAPVAREVNQVIAAAESGELSDAELVQFFDKVNRSMPALFNRLDVSSLADLLEDSLGAGALAGIKSAVGQRKVE